MRESEAFLGAPADNARSQEGCNDRKKHESLRQNAFDVRRSGGGSPKGYVDRLRHAGVYIRPITKAQNL